MSQIDTEGALSIATATLLLIFPALIALHVEREHFGRCFNTQSGSFPSHESKYIVSAEYAVCESLSFNTTVRISKGGSASDSEVVIQIPSFIKLDDYLSTDHQLVLQWLWPDKALLIYPEGLSARIGGEIRPLTEIESSQIEALGARFELVTYEP